MSTAAQPHETVGAKLDFLAQFLAPASKRVMFFLRAARDADHFLDSPLVCAHADVRWHQQSHVSLAQAEAEWNEAAAKIGGLCFVNHQDEGADKVGKITWRKAEFVDVNSASHVGLRYVFADYTVAEPGTILLVQADYLVTQESFDKLYATLEPAAAQPAAAASPLEPS